MAKKGKKMKNGTKINLKYKIHKKEKKNIKVVK